VNVSDPVSRALEDVVTRFTALVRRVGWRHGLAAHDVDEVMQDVRIRLWKAHDDGEQIAALSTSYVYRVAVTATLDLLRRRRGVESLDTGHAGAGGPHEPGADAGVDHALDVVELERVVLSIVDDISPSRRPVLRMHLMGYSRGEIAGLMGWSEAKTRNLLYRGLADLRAGLTKRGIGPHGGTQ
jgi:RNA polymerase sigma factor (sigma-70 family)